MRPAQYQHRNHHARLLLIIIVLVALGTLRLVTEDRLGQKAAKDNCVYPRTIESILNPDQNSSCVSP